MRTTAADLRWTKTPGRLADRFDGFAQRADAIGARGSARQLRSLAEQLRALPCRQRIAEVATEVGEALERALAAVAETPDLARVLAIWREAHDLATHPKRLNSPGGVALLPVDARREVALRLVAAQPRAGTPEALQRAEKAMASKRARGTVFVFTDEHRARAHEARQQKVSPERRQEIARIAVAARIARRA